MSIHLNYKIAHLYVNVLLKKNDNDATIVDS